MNRENAIELHDIVMKFRMTKQKISGLKEYVVMKVKRNLEYTDFVALDHVDFSVKKGEVVGLIGLNGSGKSTTLKIISGILKPTEGSVEVAGVISPLIELGAGFDMDLTGRENIFLNGAVLGFSKREMQKKLSSIITFAELEEFIDTPIKNYSSGMVARLAFAIATSVNPEILIVDEILGVGDFLFQQKCENRVADMMAGGTTVLVVSHSLDQIRRLCDRVVWLDHGKIVDIGDTKTICDRYEQQQK